MQTLILREAPKAPAEDEDLGLETDPTLTTDPAPPDAPDHVDPGTTGAGDGDPPEEEDGGTGGDPENPDSEPPADDGSTGDGLDDDDDDEELGGDEETTGEETDPVAEQLRRERLYDSVSDAQLHAKELSSTAAFIINRSQDATALKFASRAKQLVDEVDEQCAIVMAKFSDLGYERARDLYATIRERVSAVAEIIKHVIDGDEDFRKSDSGDPQRNGSAPGNGRGRSE